MPPRKLRADTKRDGAKILAKQHKINLMMHGFSLLRCIKILALLSTVTTAFIVPRVPRVSRSAFEISSSLSEELGLHERFDRWRFMQKLLDEETKPEYTNRLLYQVLDGYIKYPRPKFAGSEETGSPERTLARMEKVALVLSLTEQDESIPLTSDPQEDVTELMSKLEELLPDPIEEEDENKGTWDTVIELNGRESVKYNQQNPTMEWQSRCLTARLLIFYDFLMLGVVDKPFNHKNEGLTP